MKQGSAAAICSLALAGTLFGMNCYVQFSTTCCDISGQGPSQSQPSGLYCGGVWCNDQIIANLGATDISVVNSGLRDYAVGTAATCTWKKSKCIGNNCDPGGAGGPFSADCYPYTAFGPSCTKGGGGGGR